ncbi:hypothetical protein BOX15_Mlig002597g1 [Macrostomum lignano]|uniref:Uncharacterized protein n=1 Tax=Macrostomum lignano TaxID=282301 RepID=A0A267DZ57_9PLAT|nr:hypothetical protein BOX15_Mlig002597g1 [Macrostomum lignano]
MVDCCSGKSLFFWDCENCTKVKDFAAFWHNNGGNGRLSCKCCKHFSSNAGCYIVSNCNVCKKFGCAKDKDHPNCCCRHYYMSGGR